MIVFIIFRLIWNQTDVRLVSNLSENDKYYLIWVWFNKISKRFLCVYIYLYMAWRQQANEWWFLLSWYFLLRYSEYMHLLAFTIH